MTWQSCAQFTKTELQLAHNDPARALRLMHNYWGPAFSKAYISLGKPNDQIDAEKIKDEVESAVGEKIGDVSGYTQLKDDAINQMLRRYLPRFAPIVATVGGALGHPVVQGAMIYIWGSTTASDAKQLQRTNDDLHQELASILRPHMKINWGTLYFESLEKGAGPLWEPVRRVP